MRYYSPLRYPGGKAKLYPFMSNMIEQLDLNNGTYIEPFAGGAAIAVQLLLTNKVSRIVLNDYDKCIYSFWRAMLTETERFIECINTAPLTVEFWQQQKDILRNQSKYSFDLGFATFYLNRTNRSGIIKGGLIGGLDQAGDWKMDARFNRSGLTERVSAIANRKNDIVIYNKDVRSFILNYLPKYSDDALVYFDPPYYEKGKQLYLNFFERKDHEEIEKLITNYVSCDWIVTYDNAPEIHEIYNNHVFRYFDLNYSAANKRLANEVMIFKSSRMIPSDKELYNNKILIK